MCVCVPVALFHGPCPCLASASWRGGPTLPAPLAATPVQRRPERPSAAQQTTDRGSAAAGEADGGHLSADPRVVNARGLALDQQLFRTTTETALQILEDMQESRIESNARPDVAAERTTSFGQGTVTGAAQRTLALDAEQCVPPSPLTSHLVLLAKTKSGARLHS
jgi:hypothetical protein